MVCIRTEIQRHRWRSQSLVARLCQTIRNGTNRKDLLPIKWGKDLSKTIMKFPIHGCKNFCALSVCFNNGPITKESWLLTLKHNFCCRLADFASWQTHQLWVDKIAPIVKTMNNTWSYQNKQIYFWLWKVQIVMNYEHKNTNKDIFKKF